MISKPIRTTGSSGNGPAASWAAPRMIGMVRPGCGWPAMSIGVCSGSAGTARPARRHPSCTDATKEGSRWRSFDSGSDRLKKW